MNRILRGAAAALVIVFVAGTLVPGPVEAKDKRQVVMLTGTVTSFGPFDFGEFPTLPTPIEVTTSEGPATIVSTVDNFFTDIFDGFNRSDPPVKSEHLVTTEVWDFGNGDQLYTDARVLATPRIEDFEDPETCDVFQPSDAVSVITGGSGRFAGALGNIRMVMEPFCVTDASGGPVPVTGTIEGVIVVWKKAK